MADWIDVMLDESFVLDSALQLMDGYGMHVVSPGVLGGVNAATKPWPGMALPAHFTTTIEIFATIFNTEAWACWQDYIDPAMNAVGWGYEWRLWHYCTGYLNMTGFFMGVFNHMTAVHMKALGKIKGPTDWDSPNTINTSPKNQRDRFVNKTDYLIALARNKIT